MLKFTKQHRLKKATEFRNIFNKGVKNHYKGITVFVGPNVQTMPRLGFAVSKKQIKTAVARNLIKRIAKEAFRKNQSSLNGIDYIVLVNKTCLNHTKTQLYDYFQKVYLRAYKQLGS